MNKSYYCEKIDYTLNFTPDAINYCCAYGGGYKIGLKIADFNKINEKEIIDNREKYIKSFAKGIIPECCKKCVFYKEKENTPNNIISNFIKSFSKTKKKVSNIFINHFKNCDCNCIYCSQKNLREEFPHHYKLTPIIKYLYDKDIIDKENLSVEFQGGNISVLDEFDSLLDEFTKNGCKCFCFYTNSIKYMQNIEQLAKKQGIQVSIITALDAGTRETYKKIKGIDAFEQTKNNIIRLKQNSNAAITLKYIVVNGVNDNITEVQNFLNLVKELNVPYTNFEIDFNDILLDEKKIFTVPKHYYKFFEFAEKYCRDNNISYCLNDYSKKILEQGHT